MPRRVDTGVRAKLRSWTVLACTVAAGALVVGSWDDSDSSRTPADDKRSPATQSLTGTVTLMQMAAAPFVSFAQVKVVDRETPFCGQVDFVATLETSGDSVRIRYPTATGQQSVRVLGKGDTFEEKFRQRTAGPLCFESVNPVREAQVRLYTPSAVGSAASKRVLMADIETPFSDPLDYQFEFETEGVPVVFTFRSNGVERRLEYLGRGTLGVGHRDPGPVFFKSLDPTRHARVRIYRVLP